jgi:hypothetical protein
MHKMCAADVFAVDPIFPVAEDMIGGVPPLVLVGASEPGKPPIDHLRSATRHTGQRRDNLPSVSQIGVSRFEGKIPRREKSSAF